MHYASPFFFYFFFFYGLSILKIHYTSLNLFFGPIIILLATYATHFGLNLKMQFHINTTKQYTYVKLSY